jgi:hypothetical protein
MEMNESVPAAAVALCSGKAPNYIICSISPGHVFLFHFWQWVLSSELDIEQNSDPNASLILSTPREVASARRRQ